MIGTRVSTLRLFRSAHASMALTSASPRSTPSLLMRRRFEVRHADSAAIRESYKRRSACLTPSPESQ